MYLEDRENISNTNITQQLNDILIKITCQYYPWQIPSLYPLTVGIRLLDSTCLQHLIHSCTVDHFNRWSPLKSILHRSPHVELSSEWFVESPLKNVSWRSSFPFFHSSLCQLFSPNNSAYIQSEDRSIQWSISFCSRLCSMCIYMCLPPAWIIRTRFFSRLTLGKWVYFFILLRFACLKQQGIFTYLLLLVVLTITFWARILQSAPSLHECFLPYLLFPIIVKIGSWQIQCTIRLQVLLSIRRSSKDGMRSLISFMCSGFGIPCITPWLFGMNLVRRSFALVCLSLAPLAISWYCPWCLDSSTHLRHKGYC